MFEEKYTKINEMCRMEVEEIPQVITTKYGQNIKLYDEFGWNHKIRIVIALYSVQNFNFPLFISNSLLIDYSARLFVINRIELCSSFSYMHEFFDLLKNIDVVDGDSDVVVFSKISSWVNLLKISINSRKWQSVFKTISAYIVFCVNNDFYGFNDYLLSMLNGKYKGLGLGKVRGKSLLDEDLRPFTKSEVQLISLSIMESNIVTVREKALLLITRDFGIRPIQLAMINEDDITINEHEKKIRLHGAKGVRKSVLRRHVNNSFYRELMPETACAIVDLIDFNVGLLDKINGFIDHYAKENNIEFDVNTRPLFPRIESYDSMYELLPDERLHKYALSQTSNYLSKEIDTAGRKIVEHEPSLKQDLKINAYKFRRTLGTSMAIAGYSQLEVAVALDHERNSSVDHYFRFNSDVISQIDSAYNSSDELMGMATIWNGDFSIEENEKNDINIIKITKIASLGVCAKKEPCEFHPTVTCYSCSKFKPFKNINHKLALVNINDLIHKFQDASTGKIENQLDMAKLTAEKIIKAVEGDKDAE